MMPPSVSESLFKTCERKNSLSSCRCEVEGQLVGLVYEVCDGVPEFTLEWMVGWIGSSGNVVHLQIGMLSIPSESSLQTTREQKLDEMFIR